MIKRGLSQLIKRMPKSQFIKPIKPLNIMHNKYNFSTYQDNQQSFNTELYIDLSTQKEKKGVLTIIPTPIGNLKDLSIRQYEALLKADIIACEDTRITGNMLNMIRQKRISDSFKDTFDIEFEQEEQKQNSNLEQDDNDENVLAIIEDFEKNTDLVISNDQQDLKRPSREERLMSKIIEIRQKARKLLQEQDSLNIYQDQLDKEDGFDSSFYGLEDEFIKYLKAKIANSKKNKGRGVLVSYHKYNETLRIERLLKILHYGLNIALVSDAGTPTISDPGYLLVNRCIKDNIAINSLPGSSAVLVALSSSGFPTDRFVFEGYLSKTQIEKEAKLERIRALQVTSVVFENQHRLPKTLLSIEKFFGENQVIFIGFEFTKMFEKKYRGTVRELYEILTDPEQTKQSHLKGEITMVIPPYTPEFNIDLHEVKEEDQRQKQNTYKEWDKQEVSSQQQQQAKKVFSYNEDLELNQILNPEKDNLMKEMEKKMKNQQQQQNNNDKQSQFKKYNPKPTGELENHIFQIDGRVLGQYLNDNLDVSNKELAALLSDILKISKTRSYNLVKSVRNQNNQNKIWNQLFTDIKKH